MVRGRDKLVKYEKSIKILIYIFSLLPSRLNLFLFSSISNFPGIIFIGIRYVILKNISLECGDNVSIHRGCHLFNISNISFGSNVSIHPLCYIDGAGGIYIGNDVSIAHNVTIMSSTHTYSNPEVLIKDQPILQKPTIIENNVWISAKVLVLAGIKVSARSILGGGSIVTKDVESNSIVVGNPAKYLKTF